MNRGREEQGMNKARAQTNLDGNEEQQESTGNSQTWISTRQHQEKPNLDSKQELMRTKGTMALKYT